MDKLNSQLNRATDVQDIDASIAADAVHRDFADLVAMFDRQLASLATGESQARLHITRAKSAAERGLELSRRLIETLGG